jgi:glycosyltransferase involved in cell wall biosynthesis
MKSTKIRVGVSGHDLKFWYPMQRALEQTGRYEFREDIWTGHCAHDETKSRAILDWADVLVAEWALGNAVWYSRHKRPGQRLLVRFHAQERRTDYPASIDYSNVEQAIFVGPHILRECVEKFQIPSSVCVVIPNFVDVDKYRLAKLGGAEYTLGLIGTAPSQKRLDRAVDTLELLAQRDSRYCLRVKGVSPASIPWVWARTTERDYYQQLYARINSGPLRHKVIFDPQNDDVHHWLRMVGTILSPSESESFHMALAEGAASGAVPVLWTREGAGEIYPEFAQVKSASEAADLIEFLNRSASGQRLRTQAPEIIRARYDSKTVSEQWDALLTAPATRGGQHKRSRNRGLLVVWAIDNWPTFHRREMLQALAANVAEDCDLLVIEPGNYLEAIGNLGWETSAELTRIAAGELARERDNLFRTRLLTGGVPAGMAKAPFQASSSDVLKVLDALVAARFPHADRVIHWVYKPDQAERLGHKRRFVYEVYDDYTIAFGSGVSDEDVARVERRILPLAEHVFFTSAPLLERKGASAKSASLVGNGVNFEPFARFRPQSGVRTGRPAAGYLGNLADFFDWDLMLDVCRGLPEMDFVFHGQIEVKRGGKHEDCLEAMRALPNTYFTGRVSRATGAAAIARYDVLLIPFVVNDAMHAVNPLKLWEYFATGVPVVSSPMDAVTESPALLRIAHSPDEWVTAIRAAVEESDAQGAAARIARAEEHRWERLTLAHAQVVRALFKGRKIPGGSTGARTSEIA